VGGEKMKRETAGWVSIVLLLFLVCDPLHFFSGWVRLIFILFSTWAVPYFYVMWRGKKSREIIEDDPSSRLRPRDRARFGEVEAPRADLPIFGPMLSSAVSRTELTKQRVYLHPDILRLLEHLEKKRSEAEKKGEEVIT
jgi:hypothetical protein